MPEPKRRTHADGTISWHAIVSLGTRPDGTRLQRRVTARTKDLCRQEIAKLLVAAGRGEVPDPGRMTVADLCARWMTSLVNVASQTMQRYEADVRLHIIPDLGAIPLAKLTTLRVQAWMEAQHATGAKPSTLLGRFGRLNEACNAAVRWGLLARNPCEGVTTPRIEASEPDAWTVEEAQRFLAANETNPLHPLYLVALGTGLRIGELLALTWADVDLDGARLTVRRTIVRNKGVGEVLGSTTKGRRIRIAPLPTPCVDALRVLRQDRPGIAEAPVFANARGRRWPSSTVRLNLVGACQRAGVPPLTPHGLRHTALTWMDEARVSAKVFQEVAGHRALATSMKYPRLTPTMERDLAAEMGARLGEEPPPKSRQSTRRKKRRVSLG